MKLYDYYRSSASYRVRIALNLKQLAYDQRPVSLLDNEQNSASYTAINPNGLVPGFSDDADSTGVLGQSIAIIEYLDECYPEPPLLPQNAFDKARCREISLAIACDIHPLNNLRVLNYLNTEFGVNQNEKMVWYHHWLQRGFQAIESLISRQNTTFCCGNSPTMADICLVPQLYNAKRFGFDTSRYQHLLEIEQRCLELPAFVKAHPDNQMP
ncbi:maleylacetoacetate isomerase [Photobacterium sanctipauli]|uniref:Maleylacetoacetate isomerase n=1 Tax=Photobacterium sanctipauli TaxID=1342794 RepID=A0A2T3NUR7_9GAMM|nr:maleylacetoacetate isomerase [Photobacterium sanctipauli]